ncbi:SMP-30/gluconolactonase/LRE family protein [Duganella sp. FT50W]|uniref:SMP-30/gluconolactonase/LRE family protein n=1 Tax=Duganella lactea TaxID=2692173 RepID=A0A6L8MGH8_9BURK|nr:SMP-30/gluconolactonase/LRE family protein [Duganella lactea]MYM82140.1 SMP-30/gluconolactonase/LRE family protein [Duganella lactea]
MNVATAAAATRGLLLTQAGQAGCALRWDAAGQCWRWPDPAGSHLYAWPAAPAAPGGLRMSEGAQVMACCESGRLLLGLGKRLGMVELPQPGQPGRALQAQVLLTVDPAEPRTSISDGCADRHGNFVFGTANTAQDQRPIGSFYQYSRRYGLRRLALPAVVKASSIAVSPDGGTLYFADAARGALMQCDYDAERAKVGNTKAFAALVAPGAGAAITDSLGNLWSVQGEGGLLVHYDRAGAVLRQLAPTPEAASALAFGGDGLAQLLVLGARGGLYGVPPDGAGKLAPGVADGLFDDGGSASTTVTHAQSD